MFSMLVSSDGTAWETDQLMRFNTIRFKDSGNGSESEAISLDKAETLKALEKVPALLLYEIATKGPNGDVVRYGRLRDIKIVNRRELTFRFDEEGRFPREMLNEFSTHIPLYQYELSHTHWAIKDGDLPTAMLDKLVKTYDVVFSFAGEDRSYVQKVADYLITKNIKVFYDGYEETNLWGKDLSEHLDLVYRHSGRFCVMFISKYYVEKMWTTAERKSAVARALKERGKEYILPARFDTTEVPGILPTVAHISLSDKTPENLGKIILEKLRGRRP